MSFNYLDRSNLSQELQVLYDKAAKGVSNGQYNDNLIDNGKESLIFEQLVSKMDENKKNTLNVNEYNHWKKSNEWVFSFIKTREQELFNLLEQIPKVQQIIESFKNDNTRCEKALTYRNENPIKTFFNDFKNLLIPMDCEYFHNHYDLNEQIKRNNKDIEYYQKELTLLINKKNNLLSEI